VADVKTLEYEEQFDLVTWIEKPFFHDGMSMAIHRFLIPGGCFIGGVRNPEHPKVRKKAQNQHTWREENGIFYLERHERKEAEGILEALLIPARQHGCAKLTLEGRWYIPEGLFILFAP
jgi:hypothetical protein